MVTFSIRALPDALTYFPPGPLNFCLFGDMSFFGDLWNSTGVDTNFQSKIFFLFSTDRMFGTVYGNSCLFFIFLLQWFFIVFFFKTVCGYRKFQLTGFLFGDLRDLQQRIFPLLAMNRWSVTAIFSFRSTCIRICFSGTEMFNVIQSQNNPCCLRLCWSIRFSVFHRDEVQLCPFQVWCVSCIALLSRPGFHFRWHRSYLQIGAYQNLKRLYCTFNRPRAGM